MKAYEKSAKRIERLHFAATAAKVLVAVLATAAAVYAMNLFFQWVTLEIMYL